MAHFDTYVCLCAICVSLRSAGSVTVSLEEKLRSAEESLAHKERTLHELREAAAAAAEEYNQAPDSPQHTEHRDSSPRCPGPMCVARCSCVRVYVCVTVHVCVCVCVCVCVTPTQTLEALWAQLDSKSLALSDAEQRFTELETVMKRMMARSAAGAVAGSLA